LNPSIGRRRDFDVAVILLNDVVEILARADRDGPQLDVVAVLTRLLSQRGAPNAIRCDQGTEFTAEALDQWAYNNGIELDFSLPGKPTVNAFA
jgi:transposase InsO family protein